MNGQVFEGGRIKVSWGKNPVPGGARYFYLLLDEQMTRVIHPSAQRSHLQVGMPSLLSGITPQQQTTQNSQQQRTPMQLPQRTPLLQIDAAAHDDPTKKANMNTVNAQYFKQKEHLLKQTEFITMPWLKNT